MKGLSALFLQDQQLETTFRVADVIKLICRSKGQCYDHDFHHFSAKKNWQFTGSPMFF
jgi:hypothetical protein